ncbi:MAG: protein kinase [Polyangiaceae bacterium]|nr:protein kinase [Polyangiaceae bacterium]
MTSLGSDNDMTTTVPGETDLASEGSITHDPFLAKVARVPSREDGPVHVAQAGDKFGRFEVRGELGRGGMGIVYAAVDPTLGREVALKVLPASGDVERRRRFLREARSAAAVTHPGIATVFEVGEQDGTVFIAMERVRGKTLRAWLDENRPVPIVAAQKIGRSIARTLAKAHELGVVHRDLKPENAMLTEDGDVKLLDFGLAKVVGSKTLDDDSTTETQEGRIMGTPCYMSPEQARGLPVDARSDVFSFGVMLYELLTGKRPFSGSTSVDLMAAITRDEPAAVSEVEPGVSAEVAAVVHRCLRKAPDDRYADARALSRDLDAACEVSALQSTLPQGPISLANPPKPKPRLSRRIVGVLAGLSLAAVASLGFWKASTGPGPNAEAMVSPGGSSSSGMAMMALPSPKSGKADAAEAYRKGMLEFRKGSSWGPNLVHATEIDPTLAEAHVQLAAAALFNSAAERSRAHYRKAMDLVDTLSDEDRVLLNAIEPLLLRQPSDWAESIRRFSKAVEKFPNDAHFWFYLAIATANFEDFAKANGYLNRAIALDPGFAHARVLLAMYTAYEGRFEAAEQAAEQCLKVAPESTLCMDLISRLRLREGKCEEMAQVARRMIAASTSRTLGEIVLAESLAARGQPLATVEQAIAQAEASRQELPVATTVATKKQFTTLRLFARMLAGDFEGAETRARELEALTQTSHMQEERGAAAKLLAQIMLETGRTREAGEVVMAFLDRRDAWEPTPSAEDIAMAKDATPFLLFAAAESERLSAAERTERRDAWLRDWEARATPIARNYLWMHAHASTAYTAEEAKNAIDVLSRQAPLPPFRPETMADAYVGRMYLLAGRPDDAITWLDGAARSCAALQFPFEHTRAFLWLGQAKESKGDTKGACGAYQVVLDRWGQAKPKSVSAGQARARVKALGCRPT